MKARTEFGGFAHDIERCVVQHIKNKPPHYNYLIQAFNNEGVDRVVIYMWDTVIKVMNPEIKTTHYFSVTLEEADCLAGSATDWTTRASMDSDQHKLLKEIEQCHDRYLGEEYELPSYIVDGDIRLEIYL